MNYLRCLLRQKIHLHNKIRSSVLLLSFLFISFQSYSTDRFVNLAATTGSNNGTSWTDAFTSLQDALAASATGDKIYVAKGTYKPSNRFDFDGSGGTDAREVTFQIPSGVEVYGGLAGTETSITQAILDARNFTTNATILSGDINDDDAFTAPSTYTNYTENAYHVVYTENVSSATKVDGFTIRGGNADVSINNTGAGWLNRGGIGNSSNPTVTNCSFSQNTAVSGGGMYNDGSNGGVSSPIFIKCSFSKNHARSGGGMFNYNVSPALKNCSFSQNTASNDGGGMHNNGRNNGVSNPLLTNCSFSKNTAINVGGGMYNDGRNNGVSSPLLTNCSFSQNTAIAGGGLYSYASVGISSPNIYNSIFWGNTGIGKSWYNDGATPNIAFSLIEEVSQAAITAGSYAGTVVGANMLYAQDPLFTNPATGDLTLQATSPALNVGDNAVIPSGVTDLAGNPRIFDTTVDLGAYEYTPLATIFVKATGGSDINTGADFANAFATLQKGLSHAGAGSKIYVAKGTYKPTQQYNFQTGATSTGDVRAVSFKIPSGVEVYGGFAGTETSFTQAILDARNFTTNPTILTGDINGNDTFSGTAPTFTYSNYTENAYHVVYTKNVASTTKVNGFTIRGGNANEVFPNESGAGWYNDGTGTGNTSNPTIINCSFSQNIATIYGGGMFNFGNNGISSPILTNCSFSQNTANRGVGMYNNGENGVSSPILTNCSFSQNIATLFGSGMFNYGRNGVSSPILTNCSFSQNTASDVGGGMFNDGENGVSSPVLTNCSFSQNTAFNGGGGMFNSAGNTGTSNPIIRNSIFWSNTAGAGKSWFNFNASPNVSHSLVEEANQADITAGSVGAVVGANMLYAQDPLFTNAATGDLTLQTTSPALNVGSNSVIPSGVTTDLAGNPRISNTTVDLGAYERQAAPEINVQGNSTNIADGSTTPVVGNATDFESSTLGVAKVVTYTIQNTGNANLTISTIVASGTHASEFAVGNFSTTVAVSGSITFDVTFTPLAAGERTAIITVNSNDSDEAAYDFAVKGTGVAIPPLPEPAPPNNFKATTVSTSQINLSWEQVTQNVTKYRLYRGNRLIGVLAPTVLVYQDTGLVADTFYNYSIISVNQRVNEVKLSTPASDNARTFPKAPVLISTTNICGSGNSIVKMSGNGAAFRVYADSTGGSPLVESINATITFPSVTQTTTFYVSIVSGSQESKRTPVTVTVEPVFAAKILGDSSIISCSDKFVLAADTIANATYVWFRGNVEVGTGATYEATFSGNYQVRISKGVCTFLSEKTTIQLNFRPIAEITERNGIAFCDSGMLNASRTNTNATYKWLLNSAVIGDGISISVSTSGIYTLQVTENTCQSIAQIDVIVGAIPQKPILETNALSLCPDTETIISIQNAENGVTYEWFRNGRNIRETGNSISTSIQGKYQVIATSTQNNSCVTTSDELEINRFDVNPVYLRISENQMSIFLEDATNSQNDIASVEWYFEGVLKSELGTQSQIEPTESGNYSAKITNQNGCIIETRVVYFKVFVGVIVTGEEDVKADVFKLYPNPSKGILKVDFPTVLSEDIEIFIFNATGQLIKTQIFEKGNQGFMIDLQKFTKGMYLIRFNQNEMSYSKSIILE